MPMMSDENCCPNEFSKTELENIKVVLDFVLGTIDVSSQNPSETFLICTPKIRNTKF